MRAFATALQGAIATGAIAARVATLFRMNLDELQDFRIKRLEEALALYGYNKAALGKALGYADGAFIRQMLTGSRPITEKTVAAIEAIDGMAGWFDPPPAPDEPLVLTDEERAWVLAHRAARLGPNPYRIASEAPDDKEGQRKSKRRAQQPKKASGEG